MNRLAPRSTFGLVILVSLLLSCAALLLGVALFAASHEALEEQLNRRIEAETASFLRHFTRGGAAELAEAVTQREEGGRVSGAGYLLVDAAGRKVAGGLNAPVPEPGWREFLYVTRPDGKQDVSQALTTRLPDGATLVVAADRGPVDASDRAFLTLSGATLATMLLIGVGSAWALGAVVRRRLGHINQTAQAIIDGDLSRRVPEDGSLSEFDQLSRTLNRMLDRNASLMETLQQVSSDIAHDLRTPLTRLQQALNGALSEDLDAQGYRRALERAADRSQEMLDIFAALLRISEIETLRIRESFQPVDLSEAVGQVADAFGPDLEASGHQLGIGEAAGAVVEGDRRLLLQLLANLVENALRHTPPGSKISLSLQTSADDVILEVADNGPGIAPEHRDKVLRRFTRLEQSRSTPGQGLGLSLVAAIAKAHFAELMLADNEPGLIVRLTFKAHPPSGG